MPTRIYVEELMRVFKTHSIKAAAHITGGSFYEKLAKAVPEGRTARLDPSTWPIPDIFKIIQKRGNVSPKEMYSVFNMGLGLVLIADQDKAVQIVKEISKKEYPIMQTPP